MTETLKPCPFCKDPGEICPTHTGYSVRYYVECSSGCCVRTSTFSTESEAVTAWNTRAPDDVAQIVAWLPIESWPGTDEAYALVCRAGNVVPFVACYDANGDEWTSWNGHYERGGKQLIPTHWMPLLVPPAERGDWKDKDDG